MQTNYQKLDWFEAGTVALIAVGVGLIFLFTFGSLEKRHQENFVSALNMFDIHQQWGKQMVAVKFAASVAIDGSQEFLDQFYQEFTEVAAIPAEQITELAAIPETFLVAYSGGGKVLGAALVVKENKNEALQLPYRFEKPKLILPKVEQMKISIIR